MSGFSAEVMATMKVDEDLDSCLNKVQVGVLMPKDGVEHDYNHARCVGEQKLVGYKKYKTRTWVDPKLDD